MTTTVWLNGWLGPAEEARVSALDHGLTVGDGVFETIKVTDGRPFALTRHLLRLARSAATLGLPSPGEVLLRKAVDEVIGAAALKGMGRLRLTVTGGAGPLGTDRGDAPPTVVAAFTAAQPWPADVAVVRVPWTRNERSSVAGAKTTSYAENVAALQAAHQQGASEALFGNGRGELCEGTGSNVFIVLGDEVLTPTLASGCLAGITRELLLEWAAKNGLPVFERDVPLAALDDAEAALLTSSTRDVQPVGVLDGRVLPGSPLVEATVELFARYAAEHDDP